MSRASWVLGSQVRKEIRREFRAHRDECMARLVAEGLSEQAAEAEAARRFGDEEVHARRCEQEAVGLRVREMRRAAFLAVLLAAAVIVALFASADAHSWPYSSVLYSHLSYGLPMALVAGVCAAAIGGRLLKSGVMLVGVLAFWVALFLGNHYGFGAWQTVPNPPEEAFVDGALLVGSLMGGWLPGGLLVVVAYALGALLQRLRPSR